MKYNGYKYCFVDVETTGVDRINNHIFQISSIITNYDLEEIDRFNLTFKPYSLKHVSSEALEKTRISIESLQASQYTSQDAYKQFKEYCCRHVSQYDKTDKMHFVAYNANFDCEFMRNFFQHHNDNYFGSLFWTPPICVMQAAAWFTQRVRGALPNFKLGTLCTAAELGWNDENAHDAEYDIRKTAELFKYLMDFNQKL